MEPRTHYQVSFTPRQALTLFLGLLLALGLAYFFGLRTGLAGGEPEPTAGEEVAAAADASPGEASDAPAGGGAELVFPAPVTGVAPHATPAPTAPPAVLQPFEDREGGAAPPPVVVVATPVPPSSGGFRVQVVSVSSRADADAEARRLTRLGFPARVEPGGGGAGAVYRVRVGPFGTRAEASDAASRLAAQGKRDTWIVPPGQ